MGSAPVPGLFGFTLARFGHLEDLSLSIRGVWQSLKNLGTVSSSRSGLCSIFRAGAQRGTVGSRGENVWRGTPRCDAHGSEGRPARPIDSAVPIPLKEHLTPGSRTE